MPHCEESLRTCARMIERALEQVLSSRTVVPMEYGGNAGTAAMTKAMIEALSPQLVEPA